MRELSIFIDESGDFGTTNEQSAYYLVTLVFHDLKYDKNIVYYDNGQIELSSILNTVFSFHFTNVEFRKAEPQKYRLLQVADFICSLELIRIKWQEKRIQ